MKKAAGKVLVLLQFLLFFYIASHFSVHNTDTFDVLLLISGLLLGVWSLSAMRKSRLRILPDPAVNAILICSGPYRLIRHPMYTSVLLFTAGLTATNQPYDVICYLSLFIVLLLKSYLEESMLSEKFDQYEDYKKKTYRLIPFIL